MSSCSPTGSMTLAILFLWASASSYKMGSAVVTTSCIALGMNLADMMPRWHRACALYAFLLNHHY